MTSITPQTHATLDGVIDAPPADALLPYMSDAGRQGALDLALAADALLLARESWQLTPVVACAGRRTEAVLRGGGPAAWSRQRR